MPEPIHVWLIEDHQTYGQRLAKALNRLEGIACPRHFTACEDAFAALTSETPPQVLLLDVGLPGISGLDGLVRLRELAPSTSIVILTVFEEDDKIFRAICAGASGYLLKTATPEEIVEAILEASHGGSPMSPHVASSVVKLLSRLTQPAASAVTLTPREHDLLRHMVDGLTAKEIAARLGISIHTADTHTRNLFGKLGVHSRAAAVARAMREKLV